MKNIKNYNDFLNEGIKDLMKGYLSQEQIDEIIYDDDLNSAMYDLQDMLNITDGGVCGVYFSKYRDADKKWEESTPVERKIMVDEYLNLELSYKRLHNESYSDDENLYESVEGVERVKDGIIYRGEKFPGFNKPKNYTGKGKYKKRVLAKEGDKIKIINYGHSDYEDYTQHKDPKRRKNFRARHNCDPVSKLSKLTRQYWACQDLW